MVAKELNEQFITEFKNYNDTLTKLDELDPETIKKRFRAMVHEFFKQIKERLAQQKNEVNHQIKSSQSLKQLE